VFSLVSVAEDRRFELLRGCPNTFSERAPQLRTSPRPSVAWGDRERRGSDGRRLRLAEARLDVGMQIPEFVPYLGPDPAGHLAADSPTARAVLERDDATPAAGAPPVLVRSQHGVLWS